MFAYAVRCSFDHAAVADEWVDWLRDEHLADVCAAGALEAEVIAVEGEGIVREVRYHFTSRQAFDRYEREHAPRLRAEGLKRFPLERGLRYERSSGEVLAVHRGA